LSKKNKSVIFPSLVSYYFKLRDDTYFEDPFEIISSCIKLLQRKTSFINNSKKGLYVFQELKKFPEQVLA